ncbi:MAG: hypothetical protein IT497_01460 [Ottowia sp.]|nr:hypothetical protein [Ottowia sp.]
MVYISNANTTALFLGKDQHMAATLSPAQQFRYEINKWVAQQPPGSGEQREIAGQRIMDAYLSSAAELDLSNLKLSTLPAELGQLTDLTVLHLAGNPLTDVAVLSALIHLTSLTLDPNILSQVDTSVRGRLSTNSDVGTPNFASFSQSTVMAPLNVLLNTTQSMIATPSSDQINNTAISQALLATLKNSPVSLQQIKSNPRDFHYANLAQYGACHSFTIAWVSLMFETGNDAMSMHTRINNLQQSSQLIMQLQKQYIVSSIDTHNSVADEALLHSQGLQATSQVERSLLGSTLLEKTCVELATEMSAPRSPAYIHSFSYIDANGQRAGHTIGYFRQMKEVNGRRVAADDYVTIFDPNYGEKRIHSSALPNAFATLMSRYSLDLRASILRRVDVDRVVREKSALFSAVKSRPLPRVG